MEALKLPPPALQAESDDSGDAGWTRRQLHQEVKWLFEQLLQKSHELDAAHAELRRLRECIADARREVEMEFATLKLHVAEELRQEQEASRALRDEVAALQRVLRSHVATKDEVWIT